MGLYARREGGRARDSMGMGGEGAMGRYVPWAVSLALERGMGT